MRGTAQVELEWLQIRVETESAVHEERYSVVEQCQKLVKLADTEEAALLQQFPQVTTTSIYFHLLSTSVCSDVATSRCLLLSGLASPNVCKPSKSTPQPPSTAADHDTETRKIETDGEQARWHQDQGQKSWEKRCVGSAHDDHENETDHEPNFDLKCTSHTYTRSFE